ncbi:unnamed protein product, partial [Cyprideis torosa]
MFHKRVTLSHHMKVHADERKHVCSYCPKAFFVKKQLKEHLNTHLGLRPFPCPHCPDTFAGNGARYNHIKLRHKPHTITQNSIRSADIVLHIERWRETEVYAPIWVIQNQLKFKQRKRNISQKLESMTSKKHLSSFESSDHNVYDGIHAEEKPVSCVTRGSKFSGNNLKVHERIHSGERPFSSKECGSKFAHEVHLKSRERIRKHRSESAPKNSYRGNSVYLFLMWIKVLSKLHSLKIHEGIHMGEKHFLMLCVDRRFLAESI